MLTSDVPLPFPVHRGLRLEGQAQFHPRAYLAALVEGLDDEQCHVLEQTPVTAIEDGKPCRVVTESGVVTARDVVVAAHVPISNLVLLQTKIAAYRSYVVAVATPDEFPPGLYWVRLTRITIFANR